MNSISAEPAWTPATLPSKLFVVDSPRNATSEAPPLRLVRHTRKAGSAALDQTVDIGPRRLRLHVDVADATRTAAVVLPLDVLIDVRIEALRDLVAYLRRRAPPRSSTTLSSARRSRLIAALRALDARLAGASYREIAAALFDVPADIGGAWKTHDARDRTIRLARYGDALMRGGYRRLLLHPYRRRL